MRRKIFIALIAIVSICLPAGTALAEGFKPSYATPSQTLFATALVFISGVIFLIVCALLFLRAAHGTAEEDVRVWPTLLFVIILAVVLRALAATVFTGYSSDISCFKGWAIAAYENGLANFYNPDMVADYPPGYMAVLWVLGWIRSAFNIEAGGALFTLIIKLPSILAEVGLAVLAYRIASKRLGRSFGLLCASFLLFNPAMFFDSSVWGQIDAVLTLFVVLTIWFLVEERYIAAAAMYALAVAFKPQAIMFAPVVGLAYVYNAFTRVIRDKKKAVLVLCGVLVAAIPLTLLLALFMHSGGVEMGVLTKWALGAQQVCASLPLPVQILIALAFTAGSAALMLLGAGIKRLAYGLGCVLAAGAVFALFIWPFTGSQEPGWSNEKYRGTIEYYNYASINAFNVYTMLGLNWGQVPSFPLFGFNIAYGTVALVLICAAVVVLQWRTREQRRFFDLAAFLVISVFMLMHGMHERYMLPACIGLLFAYIYTRDNSTLFFAAAFSIYALLNEMFTLYAETQVAPAMPTFVLSVVGVALYIIYAAVTVRKLWSKKVLIKTPAMQG